MSRRKGRSLQEMQEGSSDEDEDEVEELMGSEGKGSVRPQYYQDDSDDDDDDDDYDDYDGDDGDDDDDDDDDDIGDKEEDDSNDGSDEYDDGEDNQRVDARNRRRLKEDNQNIPLSEMLRRQEAQDVTISSSNAPSTRKQQRRKRGEGMVGEKYTDDSEDIEMGKKGLKRRNKNAPSVMPSNRAVKRFRENSNLSIGFKPHDPRFSELNGKLDYDIFLQSYNFLDAKQEMEMKKLEKRIKKTKGQDKKTELKQSYHRIKQDLVARRRHVNLKEKLKETKKVEKEKVANGKKPFFLKESAKKKIALEQQYQELKSKGKLQAFIEKKNKKSAQKEHKWMPTTRRTTEV